METEPKQPRTKNGSWDQRRDGASRESRRRGTKALVRINSQRATRGIIPRVRRRFAQGRTA